MHDVKTGLRTRKSFSQIEEVLEMPNLIEVQRKSFKRFLEYDLREAFDDISPISDYSENWQLNFLDYHLNGKPKYTIEECRDRDMTYAVPLRVRVQLVNCVTGEKKEEQEVFMGDFPMMTPEGAFVINGADRVVVSQLMRSPSVYFGSSRDKTGKILYSAQVIPNRGAWLEFESDSNDCVFVRIDRTRKLPITPLLRALGCGTNGQLYERFGESESLLATLERDDADSEERGLLEVYKRLRPGEPPTVESARALLGSLFFDSKRYDLARVGRYKFNKKLSMAKRLVHQVSMENVVSPLTGEVLVTAGQTIDREAAQAIQDNGVEAVWLQFDEGRTFKVFGNNFVAPAAWLPFDPAEIKMPTQVYLPVLRRIIAAADGNVDTLKDMLKTSFGELTPKWILTDDIMAAVNYHFGLGYGLGTTDDIDHLGNRRLRSVGELLQNQIRIGLTRLERVVKERMAIQEMEAMKPSDLINIRPVTAAIKEFFGSSQLSQFMDHPNPLAEITHKRRLSALGPGGLNRERASFEVRDVHHSHYGRICPIETPEGPNIGLIGSLAIYARVNEFGFIEAPYRLVDFGTHTVTNQVVYLTADEEEINVVAQANEPLDENNWFVNERVMVRIGDDITEVSRDIVSLMDVSPKQLVSVATGMIPFLENDDPSRALMGANMQRQGVPLLVPQAPRIGTGMESKAAQDSGVVMLAPESGEIMKVSASNIVLKGQSGVIHTLPLRKFDRSNQGTCINQHPLVVPDQKVSAGEIICDGSSTERGEIALGRNVLVAFMVWEGYNFEDAILINEKLVKGDVFTSIHIEEYECEARDTKLGPEEITRDIPNVGDALRDLDERGIVRIGAEVRAGDILVGKVTPKGETELTAEERLLRAIFGEKAREVRDMSLRVPHGEGGVVVDVRVFTRENRDELLAGANSMVRVSIAQKRKVSVGDKMAGRHGNKGVIARILPEEDMPFMEDGTPLDIVLNPMGVPSRMNVGQVLEVHLGLVARALDLHIATPVFDGAHERDIRHMLDENGFAEDGKMQLYDGRSGEPFENRVTVGVMYMMKLHHLVDDKIHARAIGPYSLVTQQPLGGKAQFGGQRFGEMEVWALEAYGAAHTLQEILTVKSDDIAGRIKTYESIVKGENIPTPGVPESFKVLIKELQSLGLDVRVLGEEARELDLERLTEDDRFMPLLDGKPLEDSEGGLSALTGLDDDLEGFELSGLSLDDLEEDDDDSLEIKL